MEMIQKIKLKLGNQECGRTGFELGENSALLNKGVRVSLGDELEKEEVGGCQ